MDIAGSMLADADRAGLKSLSLDGIRRAAPQAHRWTVAGTAAATTDQVAFYNLKADTTESGATAGTATPPSGWSTAEIARYIADNPAPLRTMHFSGASADDLLERTIIRFLRSTPDAAQQQETVFLSTYVHDGRFQPKVLSVPINGEVLDGYTYPRVLSPGASGAQSYTLTFAFGATNDKRADVPPAGGAVVAPIR